MSEANRIGIYGGTFDPFHRGHVEPIASVVDELAWDQVVFVPAWRQPFKAERVTTSPYHRFAMTVLGVEEHERFLVSPVELERGTLSYTVETLEWFRRGNRAATLDWIIGDDNLGKLGEWRSIDRIFELANFVVLRRGGVHSLPDRFAGRVTTAAQRGSSGAMVLAGNRRVAISATEVRAKIAAGENVDEFVQSRVRSYIRRNRLYVGG